MSVTVDCGEAKHDLCSGTGSTAYLFPQESGERFYCGCRCHHVPDAKVPCKDPVHDPEAVKEADQFWRIRADLEGTE